MKNKEKCIQHTVQSGEKDIDEMLYTFNIYNDLELCFFIIDILESRTFSELLRIWP